MLHCLLHVSDIPLWPFWQVHKHPALHKFFYIKMPRTALWTGVRACKKSKQKGWKHKTNQRENLFIYLAHISTHFAANLLLPRLCCHGRLVNFIEKNILPLSSGWCSKSIWGQSITEPWLVVPLEEVCCWSSASANQTHSARYCSKCRCILLYNLHDWKGNWT